MRIGLFTDTYPPFINGVSTSVSMLKKALQELGHDVYVITLNDNATKLEILEDGHIIKIPGIKAGIYDYRITGVYPIKVTRLLKSLHFDVIHSHTEFSMGIYARILANQENIPLVHTYHTMYEDYIHYITKGHFAKSSLMILKYLTRFYCDKTATELIVPTKKTYDIFRQKYEINKNVHIVPSGIEVERFYRENINIKEVNKLKEKYNLTKKDFILFFVGRVACEKSIDVIINAMPDLLKKHNNIKLIIVGDGPQKDFYEEIVSHLNITDNVIFTGRVPWTDVPLYYSLADVFVMPSTSETQGLTVVEAMANNVCPVCVADDAYANVVVDKLNGCIFHNPDEMKDIILDLYNNPTKLKSYSKQARTSSELLSSKHYALNVLTVYECALKNQKSSFGWFSGIIDKMKKGKK